MVRCRWEWSEGCCLIQCAVGPMVVEMRHVLGQHALEVAAVDDQHPVGQLTADGADSAFGDRVRLRCSHRCAPDADAFAGGDGVDCVGELGVAIPDQERALSRAVAEVHQEVACLLSDPSSVGVRRDAPEVDTAGGVLEDDRHREPVKQQGVDAEKKSVARIP
jgi:hypothetical protein